MKDGALPPRLTELHIGEEALRSASSALVEEHSNLRAHLDVVECAMDLMDVLRRVGSEAEDEKVIQLLGMRIFNDLASSVKLALTGYNQSAAMILRDILETTFLIERFAGDWPAVSQWRLAAPKERWKNFGPAKVRAHLDKRDGFRGKKRDAAYGLLSTLASHPTMEGVAMLRPTGMDAHLGPFVELPTLEAVLAEMAKLAVQAGEAVWDFLPLEDAVVQRSMSDFSASKIAWFKEIGITLKQST